MSNSEMTVPPTGPSLTLDNEELARDYDRISADRQFEAGKRLAQDLMIARDERVLDVGCGTGLLAEYIADLTGASGHVLGIDPLPFRIALAQARARAFLEFRVGDAYHLAMLRDSDFDVVCLNSVFHWLPEKTGPLQEFARVLKPGGRLGMSTSLGGPPSLLREAATKILARPPFADYPAPSGHFTYRVTQREMRDLLESAGFKVMRLDTHAVVRQYATPEDAIRFSEASTFGNFLRHLPEDLRLQARGQIKRELEAKMTSEGLREERHRLVAVALRS